MKERATLIFPYVIAVLLPLAGLVLAVAWGADGRREEASRLVGAALLGSVLYFLLLS